MKHIRKNLAVALVAVQFLLMPGTGVYQAAAINTAMKGTRFGSVRLGMTRSLVPVRIDSVIKTKSVPDIDVANGGIATVEASVGVNQDIAAGQVEAAAEVQTDRRDSDEKIVAADQQTWDQAGVLAKTPAVEAVSDAAAANAATVLSRPISGAADGIVAVPAPAEKPGKLDTAINISAIPVLAASYAWIIPVATALGTVIYYVFSTGVNVAIPVNWPHYIMAGLGHGLGFASSALAPLVEPVKQVAQSVIELGKSNAPGMYVYGQIVLAYGYAAGVLSPVMHYAASTAQQASSFLLDYAPRTFDLSAYIGLKDIPTINWYWVTAAISNVAYYGKATLISNTVAKKYPAFGQNAAVTLVTRALDMGLVAPAMLFKDGFNKLVRPFVKNIWQVVKDVAQFIYDYPLTFAGHVGRSVGTAAIMGAVSSVVGPAIIMSSLAMNYLVTPSYRALKAAVNTRISLTVLVGAGVVAGFGVFVYVAGLTAFLLAAGPLVVKGFLTLSWLMALPFFAIGVGTGAYHGYTKKFINALDGSWQYTKQSKELLQKAFSTFKRAEQEKN